MIIQYIKTIAIKYFIFKKALLSLEWVGRAPGYGAIGGGPEGERRSDRLAARRHVPSFCKMVLLKRFAEYFY